jgi:hypothetical protein
MGLFFDFFVLGFHRSYAVVTEFAVLCTKQGRSDRLTTLLKSLIGRPKIG